MSDNNKIFLLTRDDYYFIIEKKFLRKSLFFNNIFLKSKNYGTLKNPIFLQKINSRYFKYIKKYLMMFYNKNDNLTDDLFESSDDDYFFNIFLEEEDNNDELVETINFFNIKSLSEKLEYYNLIKKQKWKYHYLKIKIDFIF